MAKWNPATDQRIAEQNEMALRRAREADRIEPRAGMVSVGIGWMWPCH